MARWLVTIRGDADRAKVALWASKAKNGMRVEFKDSKRSIPQNDRLWACLTDIAQQVEWYGQKLSTTDWKDMFTASLRKGRVVPGIDQGSFVVLGQHTSDMTKDELSELLELMMAFGAEHGVRFNDPAEIAA